MPRRPGLFKRALVVRVELVVEPGACVGPVPVGGADRDTHDGGGLRGGEPPEIAELDDFGGGRLFAVRGR